MDAKAYATGLKEDDGMGHDEGLLALAIESILADCGGLGVSWGTLSSEEIPAWHPSPDPTDRLDERSGVADAVE